MNDTLAPSDSNSHELAHPIAIHAPATETVVESPRCPNCGQPKPAGDAYCRHCGQKHTRLSDGLGYFVADFFTSLLSVDGRAFRTISTLFFRPGKAAADFLEGRRVRYLSSAQTYLVSGFCFFLLLGRWVEVPEIADQLEWRQNGQQLTWEPTNFTSNEATSADPAADRLRRTQLDLYHDVREITLFGQKAWISFAQFREFATQSERSIKQFFLDQDVELSPWVIHMIKNGSLLTTDFGIAYYVNNSIALASQIALLLLPLLAVLIRVFHWWSCRTWLAAFIVSAHFHSTMYLFLGGLMLLNLGIEWVFPLGGLACLGYWLTTLRRVFHQSWWVIGLKTCFIVPCYLGGVLIAVLAATVGTIFVI